MRISVTNSPSYLFVLSESVATVSCRNLLGTLRGLGGGVQPRFSCRLTPLWRGWLLARCWSSACNRLALPAFRWHVAGIVALRFPLRTALAAGFEPRLRIARRDYLRLRRRLLRGGKLRHRRWRLWASFNAGFR